MIRYTPSSPSLSPGCEARAASEIRSQGGFGGMKPKGGFTPSVSGRCQVCPAYLMDFNVFYLIKLLGLSRFCLIIKINEAIFFPI